MTRKGWLLGAAVATITVTAFGGTSLAQGGRCNRDDIVCRMDVLERKLDRLIWLMEGQAPAPAPAAPPPVTMPTDRYCNTDCVQEAVAACQTAKFNSGVPNIVQPNPGGWGKTLKSVTCYP